MEIRRFNGNDIKGTLAHSIIDFLHNDMRVFQHNEMKNYLFGLFDGFDYSDDIMKLAFIIFDDDRNMTRLVCDLCDHIKKVK
jgi:hypothetical protein